MRGFAGVVLVFNLLHIVLALFLASSTGVEKIPIYTFALPHLFAVAAALCLLASYVLRSRASTGMFTLTGVVLALSLATAFYAMFSWPGGNDGPGIGWGYFVVGLSILNMLAGLTFVSAAFAERFRSNVGQ
jgi:hypothetical protein